MANNIAMMACRGADPSLIHNLEGLSISSQCKTHHSLYLGTYSTTCKAPIVKQKKMMKQAAQIGKKSDWKAVTEYTSRMEMV